MDIKGAVPVRHTGTDRENGDDSPENETEFEHTGNILSTYNDTGDTDVSVLSDIKKANICSCWYVKGGNDTHTEGEESEKLKFPHTSNIN